MSAAHSKKTQGMIANLPAKTGKTLEEWVAILRAQGPAEQKQWADWLKATHGLGHFQARLVATEAKKQTK